MSEGKGRGWQVQGRENLMCDNRDKCGVMSSSSSFPYLGPPCGRPATEGRL